MPGPPQQPAAPLPPLTEAPTKFGLFDPDATCEAILKGRFDPRKLTPEQRRNCVEYLKFELRLDNAKVARIVGVHRKTVESDLKRVHQAYSRRLKDGDVAATLAAELMAELRATLNLAYAQRNPSAAVRTIEAMKDLADDLRQLEKAADAVNHRDAEDDGAAFDLRRLAQGAASTGSRYADPTLEDDGLGEMAKPTPASGPGVDGGPVQESDDDRADGARSEVG